MLTLLTYLFQNKSINILICTIIQEIQPIMIKFAYTIAYTIALMFMFSLATSEQLHQNQDNPSVRQYRSFNQKNNLQFIQTHNANPQKKYTLNNYQRFSSFTFQELEKMYLMNNFYINHHLLQQNTPTKSIKVFTNQTILKGNQNASVPVSTSFFVTKDVNWTRDGKVSSVKDQGFCGSCYAFAAIGDIQSSYLFKNIGIDLSEQQIISCSHSFLNFGCDGGWMGSAFAYVNVNGVNSEERYPNEQLTVESGMVGECRYRKGPYKIRRYTYTSYKTDDCLALSRIVEQRPVTAAVAVNMEFFFYQQGVLQVCGDFINHGVLVTGLRQNTQQNFWIVKNSWGQDWGELGYINIDRSLLGGNLCSICFAPSYSIL